MDPRIDRLRGLLAIGVLLGHVIDLAHLSAPDASGTLFSIAMATRPYFGFVCVIGFIVLSGYCIARSTMTRFVPGEYAVMRVTRVYPLLIAAVLLTALVEWMAAGSANRPEMWVLGRDIRKFFVALAGFSGFKGPFGALAPAYTISFELMYYAIWGLAMIAALGRSRRALLISAVTAIVLLAVGSRLRGMLGWFAGFVPAAGIALFPGWLLGAGLALMQEQVTAVARVIPNWVAWLLFVTVYAYLIDTVDIFHVVYMTLIAGLYFTIVAAWLSRPTPERNATDTWLGEMSYPLFVIHGPTIMGVQFALNAWHVRLTFATELAILTTASFAVATLLLMLVERPVMAWRRQLKNGRVSISRATVPHAAVLE